MTRTRISSVVVVIPARDEAQLIGRCLTAVLESRRVLEAGSVLGSKRAIPRVSVLVVADNCTDDTAEVARRFDGVSVVEISAGAVGVARATGVLAALATSALDPAHTWIANTDADSVVSPRWLVEQLAFARRGAAVLLGTVRPELADLSPEQARVWTALRRAHPGTGSVHGANLGLRADIYIDAGGFSHLAEHEDAQLVQRCVELEVPIATTARCEVVTSGRQLGRTPGGYARYLRTDLLAALSTDPVP